MKQTRKEMKILIIKLRNIGDTLLITPLFENLKIHFGESSILDVLVNAGTEGILPHQNIRKIHILKRAGKFQKLQYGIKLLRAIRDEKYDIVISLTSGERSAFLSLVSGAKMRIGFSPKAFWARPIYTHNLQEKYQHTIDNNLEALRVLNIPIITKKVQAAKSQELPNFQIPKNFIHLHFFSRWMFKCLSEDFCAKILDFITQTYQIECLLTCSNQQELEKLQSILNLVKHKPKALNNFSLAEVSYLNSKAKAFVGVDTAIMHLSAANNIPTFAFFGPSGVINWGPWDNDLLTSTYTQKNGIQRMGKHLAYQESFACVPCGRDGCEGSKKSDCLLTRLNEKVALATLKSFLDPLLLPSKEGES